MEQLLTKEERKAIDGYFKTKEYRLLAHELMNWTHEPTIREGRLVAEKYGITTEQMRRVIRILKNKELFTKAEGSIPLYRQRLKREAEARLPPLGDEPYEIERHVQGETVDLGEPDEEVQPADSDLGLGESEPSETPEWPSEEFETLKLQVSGIRTRMGGLEEHMEDIKGFMAQISAQGSLNPTPFEADADPELEPTVEAATFNPLQQEETDDIVEMPGRIIAKRTVGFTPKSLMLFDLTVSEGFKGTFADFVNTCIGDAFRGRGIELAVIDRKVIA